MKEKGEEGEYRLGATQNVNSVGDHNMSLGSAPLEKERVKWAEIWSDGQKRVMKRTVKTKLVFSFYFPFSAPYNFLCEIDTSRVESITSNLCPYFALQLDGADCLTWLSLTTHVLSRHPAPSALTTSYVAGFRHPHVIPVQRSKIVKPLLCPKILTLCWGG